MRSGWPLSVPGGFPITTIAWVVTNSVTSFTSNGVIPLGDAESIEIVVGGLPAGAGYSIDLTATDAMGDPCAGAVTFAVVAGGTAHAIVNMTCTRPADASLPPDVTTGVVAVDAAVVRVAVPEGPACPGIMSLSISPAQQRIGSSSTLGLVTLGPTPVVSWTQSGAGAGTFGDAGVSPTTFACSTPGTVTIEATVALPDSGSCTGVAYTTATGTLACETQCDSASDCPVSPTVCASPACVAHVCGLTYAPLGTACTDGGGQICDGGGFCVVPTFAVVRVGDGFSALSGTASPVFIDRYDLSGALVGTPVALPTVVTGNQQNLTLPGTAISEGDLNVSQDGRYLTLAGYAVSTGTSVTSGNRVAGRVDSAGHVDTSMVLTNAFVGGVARSAVSLDGSQIWASGTANDTSGGIWYLPGDLDIVQLPSTALPGVKARWLGIAAGQLYGDSDQDPPDLFAVGTGAPTSGSPTLATLPGLPASGGSPYGFAFFDLSASVPGPDTLYIADDRRSTGGGLEKWVLGPGDGGTPTWTQVWVVAFGAMDAGTGTGFRGLAGYVTGTTVTLMATTGMAMGAQDQLAVVVDTGTGTPTPAVVATSLTNETFRGIAVPPHR